MSKLVRVGEIPKTIRVNFALDSTKYPDLAQWLYGMPYGKMSENIREILVLAARGQLQRVDGKPLLGGDETPVVVTHPAQRPSAAPGVAAAPLSPVVEHNPEVVTAAVFDPHHAMVTTHSSMPPIGAPSSPVLQQALASGGGVLDGNVSTENSRTISDISDAM